MANIKAIIWGLLGLLLIGGLIAGTLLIRTPSPPVAVSSTGISVAALKEVAHLTVLEVPMTDIVTSERTGPLHLGNQRCLLTIRGIAEVGSNIEQARFVDVNDTSRTATLVLPMPTALSVRIDHARSGVHEISRGGLWKIVPDEIGSERLTDAAWMKAETMLRQAASTTENIERAKQQAARVITEACARMGWSITLRWV